MANKSPPKSEKEKRIDKERKRLIKIFRDLKSNGKIQAAYELINRAAFMKVTLEDYEADINKNGSTELFKQGDKQEPYERQRPVADLYNKMNTSYQKITKQLTDLLPEEKKKETDPFIDFIGSDDK